MSSRTRAEDVIPHARDVRAAKRGNPDTGKTQLDQEGDVRAATARMVVAVRKAYVLAV